MKLLTTAALAALLVGGMGGALTLVPAANADDAAVPAAQATPAAPAQVAPDTDVARAGDDGMPGRPGMMGRWGQRGHMGGMGLRGNLLDIACGDRGAEALEIAFVHLNYAVKPTADQAPLLDTLKTTALADQKTFAAACQTAMSGVKDGKGDLLDRLQSRLTLDNARVAALTDVLPKFKAFYDSLTDDQKAKLQPPMGGPRAAFNGQWGQHGWRHGQGHMGHMGDPNGGPGQNPGDADATPDQAPAAQS